MPEERMQLEVDLVVKVSIELIKNVWLKNVYSVVNMVLRTIKKKRPKTYSTKMEKEKQSQWQPLPQTSQNSTEYYQTKRSWMQLLKSIKFSIVKVNSESVSLSIPNSL